MSERLFDALVDTGQVPDADAVAMSINELRARYQVTDTVAFTGEPARALDIARGQIVEVEDAERAIAWARELLPPLEQRVAMLEKAARGRYILPAILVIIVLAIVIGQLL